MLHVWSSDLPLRLCPMSNLQIYHTFVRVLTWFLLLFPIWLIFYENNTRENNWSDIYNVYHNIISSLFSLFFSLMISAFVIVHILRGREMVQIKFSSPWNIYDRVNLVLDRWYQTCVLCLDLRMNSCPKNNGSKQYKETYKVVRI